MEEQERKSRSKKIPSTMPTKKIQKKKPVKSVGKKPNGSDLNKGQTKTRNQTKK
jgi:hypothetical protein